MAKHVIAEGYTFTPSTKTIVINNKYIIPNKYYIFDYTIDWIVIDAVICGNLFPELKDPTSVTYDIYKDCVLFTICNLDVQCFHICLNYYYFFLGIYYLLSKSHSSLIFTFLWSL